MADFTALANPVSLSVGSRGALSESPSRGLPARAAAARAWRVRAAKTPESWSSSKREKRGESAKKEFEVFDHRKGSKAPPSSSNFAALAGTTSTADPAAKSTEEEEEEEGEEEVGRGSADVEARKKEKKGKKGKKEKERKIKFVKYQGLGNDFILVDNLKQSEPLVDPQEAVALCSRNFGVGGDGVIFLLPTNKGGEALYGMRIFNSDGSEPEMCGNGIRCLARFIADVEGHKGAQRYVVSTLAGNMVLKLQEDGQVRVDMGEPILEASRIPTILSPTTEPGAVVKAPLDVAGMTWQVTCVSMGNPHCVVFSNSEHPEGLDVASLDLSTLGPQFEKHPAFPAKINTEFVQVISRGVLRMRVWERGAGPTLACGTGACALVVAAVLEGRADRSCLVHLPGGPLHIEWNAEDNHVYMTGPAEEVFSGRVVLPSKA